MSRDTPEVAVVAAGERELRLFRHLLEHAGLPARTALCTSGEALRARLDRGAVDLVACWADRAPVAPAEMRRILASARERPALLLVAEGVRSHHYVAAARIGAGDVVDCGNPAQLGFCVRRELGQADLRRRLRQARRMLEEERVLDEQSLEPPDDTGTLPPLVHTIDRALNDDLLEVVYQPIVSLREDPFESYEAFVRLPTPEGPLMPGDFLPVATRHGLMPAIDRAVIARAVERFGAERSRGQGTRPLRFFLNVSAATLMESPAVRDILHCIADAHAPPGSFVIELDKRTVLSRLKLAKSFHHLLRRLHLQFAMDHYDTSDTRLNYTHHVQLDYIKLNRSLVDGIERRPGQRRQVETVCASARAAGIRVIASQVERIGELGPLFDAGIDYVQGNLVGEPSREVEHDVDARVVLGSLPSAPR